MIEERTIPVTPHVAADIVREIQRTLGAQWRVMPIGGTRMGAIVGSMFTTKDIDIVLVVVESGTLRVPTLKELEGAASKLGKITKVRENSTSIALHVQTTAGPVLLELIRGMSPGKGGYFPTTKVFEAVAKLAVEKDGRLEIPEEALAFLKAWAVNDKEKRIAAGKDPEGRHARRLDAFHQDVNQILRSLLAANKAPEIQVVEQLLAASPPQRAKDIRRIMIADGWVLSAAKK